MKIHKKELFFVKLYDRMVGIVGKKQKKENTALYHKNDFILLKEEEPQTEVKETQPARSGKSRNKSTEVKHPGLWKKILLCVGTFLGLLIVTVIAVCHVLLNGPSPTMRDALVLSAKQASATKWLPGLFLDDALVAQIELDSKTVTYDVVSIDDIAPKPDAEGKDEWADAIDGIKFVRIDKPAFKAYLLMVKDPSRLFVGTSSDFKSGATGGKIIFDIAEKYQAVAAINGGEFPDTGGVGNGAVPIGITFAGGELVYNGHTNRTFMGFTSDNRLIVSEGMTAARGKELGIRDGVCFQTGNCLITNDGQNVTLHYADGNVGRAQRTAIGQRADGTVLLLVTDGRTASSVGATHNELIEIMLEYGAIAAGKLDGGSSAMMYYRDYYDLYDYDMSTLDEYQRKGLVNNYKAFTKPRNLPTYFIVGASKQ